MLKRPSGAINDQTTPWQDLYDSAWWRFNPGRVCGSFTCDAKVNIALGLRLVPQRRAESLPRLAASLAFALHCFLYARKDGVSVASVRWKKDLRFSLHSPASNGSMRRRAKYIWASCPASDVLKARSKALRVTSPRHNIRAPAELSRGIQTSRN